MRRTRAARFVLLAAMLLSLMAPGIGKAELVTGRVDVLGMTWEFCEKALEKALQKIQGVDRAHADLVKGYGTFTFKKGAILDLDRIATKVRDGGVTLKNIHVTVRGQIVDKQGRKTLKVSGTDQILLVVDGLQMASLENGEEVTVTGQVEKTSDGKQIVLSVREVN